MKFLSRKRPHLFPVSLNARDSTDPPGHLHIITDMTCIECWRSATEITKLFNFCASQQLPVDLIAAPCEAISSQAPSTTDGLSFKRLSAEESALTPGRMDGNRPESPDTEEDYPSRSIVAAKLLIQLRNRPAGDIARFFSHAQQQYFEHAQNPYQLEFYRETCQALSLNHSAFEDVMRSPLSASTLHQERSTSSILGAHSTPAVVWRQDGHYRLLASGPLDYEIIRFRVRQLILQG